MKKIFLFIFFFMMVSVTQANTMYVQSPVAKLLDSPVASAKGEAVALGTQVRKTGEKDLFIKVSINGKEGWINKLFLSTTPPSGKVSFGNEIDKSTSVKARARASAFTQTAAARGYSKSESNRVRGAAEEYDFESISWLEKLEIQDLNK
jgi:hypothetical protein